MNANSGDTTSVGRALKALIEIGRSKKGLSVSGLAREIGVDKSTVSRLLATMSALDFVRRERQKGEFKLGPAVMMLGRMASAQYDMREQIVGALAKLSELTSECAHAAVICENGALYVEQVQPDRPFILDAPIGTIAPLHCTALGKALLIGLPESELRAVVAKLELTRFTALTITSEVELLAHLERARTEGIGRDHEEYTIGVRCIAAPVFKAPGVLSCAIGVSGPSPRLSEDKIKGFSFIVKEIAAKLSGELGYEQPHLGGVILSDKAASI